MNTFWLKYKDEINVLWSKCKNERYYLCFAISRVKTLLQYKKPNNHNGILFWWLYSMLNET